MKYVINSTWRDDNNASLPSNLQIPELYLNDGRMYVEDSTIAFIDANDDGVIDWATQTGGLELVENTDVVSEVMEYNRDASEEYVNLSVPHAGFLMDMMPKPFLNGNLDISLFHNTTTDIVLTGENLDDGLDIDFGSAVTINSVTSTSPSEIIVNCTVGATLQAPLTISVKRGSVESYGDVLTCEVTDIVIGTGSAGTFTTDFDTGTNSASWGADWALEIYGNINSLDQYFVTSAYNVATPSSNTGPDTSDVFGNGSGQYMFTEASNPNNGVGQYAIARTTNFNELTDISFKYHMYGSNHGSLAVYTQNYDGTWNQEWLVTGQQHSNAGDTASTFSLSKVDWNVKAIEIRFNKDSATPTNGYMADIAIDDIEITSI